MIQMDPSICRLHPGVAVTGFCPACLRDRLAGLQPPSAADLRRCKSFSYARSAAAVEPQRRSCDLFRQPIVAAAAAMPEEDYRRPQEQEARKSSSFLGRKLQQWRRKNKQTCNKDPAPAEMSGRHHHHRPSCDAGPPSWDARSGPVLPRQLPAMMLSSLSVEEDDDNDMMVPRSDGQIPVEEDYYYNGVAAAVPGGSVQTRDYYLDSSSRRRRSVDRAATSGRNSFSDANNNNGGGELPTTSNGGNAKRVSPAVVGAAERLYHHHYHEAHQSVLVHHHQYLRRDDAPQIPASRPPSTTKTKGIRGWSIWGLINKKSSSKQRQPEASFFSSEAATAGTGGAEYPWPELRARGYDGQMLRCNSSISARSSFSGGSDAAMIGRRSISGVDFRDHGVHGVGLPPPDSRRTTRRDEVLLERTRSSSSSYSTRSGNNYGGIDSNNPAMGISSRPPGIPRRRPSSKQQHEQRRSTLGLQGRSQYEFHGAGFHEY